MATFYNQASLSYNGGVTNSNVTEGELSTGITLTKIALSSGYAQGSELVYLVTLTNNGAAMTDARVTDDLGAYTVGASTVYPLEYVEGSVLLFRDGALDAAPTVIDAQPLTFGGIDIAPGETVTLIYRATLTAFAPLQAGAQIVNTATLAGGTACDGVSDSATVSALDTVSLTIAKAISPAVVTDNGTLSYTFIIQNTGNTPVVATDNAIVTDTFNPILNPITVTLNGVALTEGVGYSYDETTGEFATLPGAIAVPAASYTQDPVSGVITTTPGNAILVVTGTV